MMRSWVPCLYARVLWKAFFFSMYMRKGTGVKSVYMFEFVHIHACIHIHACMCMLANPNVFFHAKTVLRQIYVYIYIYIYIYTPA